MNWRPAPAAPALDSGNRRLLERLLASPLLIPEQAPLRQMLQAGNKGGFEQESLGRPTTRHWPFYAPTPTPA